MSKYVFAGVILLLIIGGFFAFRYKDFFKKPTVETSTIPQAAPINSDDEDLSDVPRVSTLVQNLDIPWSLVFLPDNSILLTERAGKVRLVGADGKLRENPVHTVSDVRHVGEGGLMGITVHPEFDQNKYVYIYYTYGGEGGTLNRVVRFKFDGSSFSERKVIVDQIPGAVNHNGGRIKFGPDKFLYVGTGDAQEESLAQDRNSLAGKILRITDEGTVPSDNPFSNAVYSLGHRNVQGLVWDSEEKLWATEHGPSGTWPNCCQDELNLIEKGKNYGWPESRGDNVLPGTVGPKAHSGRDTWAPSGMASVGNSVFFTGLRGSALFEAQLNSQNTVIKTHFKNEFGRIRDVVLGPNGLMYMLTNNTDGRGRQAESDDKILVINPNKL